MCGNIIGLHTLVESTTGIQWVAERVDATFLKTDKKDDTHRHTYTQKKKRNIQAERSVEARLRNLVLYGRDGEKQREKE